MRISLTVKFVIGVILILVVSLAILQRKANGILLNDKIQTLKEQSSQVSYSLAISAGEKVKRLDRHLRLILTHAALNTPKELRPQGEDMLVVGILLRSVGKSWETNWAIKGPVDDKVIEKFGQDFAVNIQKATQLDKIRSDQHNFTRLVSIDGQPLFVMLIRLSKMTDPVERIAVGVLSASTFFDLVAPFKGSLTTAFLVDQSGVAYAHPNVSLTGSLIQQNPVVDKIAQKFAAYQVDEYKIGDDTVIASFDYIPRTNLVAVTSISLTKSSVSLNELKWNFIVLGFGLSILAMFLAIYISRLMRAPLSKLRRTVDDLAQGRRTQMLADTGEVEISDLATSLSELDKKLRIKDIEVQADTHDKIYKEKMSAFHRLSTGLVNELRNPLIGVLGHTQLAREKIRDPESIRRHLDLIERDVRKTKELVEDISQFAGAEKLELESVNIFEALTAAIEQAGRKLHAQNISILKNLDSVSSVKANAVLLRKALLNTLSSCADLVKAESSREVIVRLETEADFAKITVIFESDLLSGEDRNRIFDPFLVTDGEVEMGLELALARGIFEAHDARIEFEQIGEQHFQFVIYLPKVKDLPATETSSPFTDHPGLEMKGLSFALPEFSLKDGKIEMPSIIDEKPEGAAPDVTPKKIASKQISSKVPLESLKIKIRKPTLRT